MSGEQFCEVCGFDHDHLLCQACGRLLFHVMLQRGAVVVSVTVACAYCDAIGSWPVVQADPEMATEVAMSAALPPRWWLSDHPSVSDRAE